MLKWLMRRRTAAFERRFQYDMEYARMILDADPRAFLAFGRASAISRYRRDVPPAPWFAAKLAATMAEDCGPCTQLVVRMAEREGVPGEVLRALLSREIGRLPDDVALAFRFAEAALRHAAAADELREEILARWGARGLVSLAFAVTAGRLFPTLKYALGHGVACTRVEVAGTALPIMRRAA